MQKLKSQTAQNCAMTGFATIVATAVRSAASSNSVNWKTASYHRRKEKSGWSYWAAMNFSKPAMNVFN
jgi:hypothetical protein